MLQNHYGNMKSFTAVKGPSFLKIIKHLNFYNFYYTSSYFMFIIEQKKIFSC